MPGNFCISISLCVICTMLTQFVISLVGDYAVFLDTLTIGEV